MKKILFILKKNEVYSFVAYTRRSSGLWNSVNFVVDALKKKGVVCEIVEVNDNNDIDREVTKFKPDTVIIEALWVVPSKFEVLKKLHPKVNWFVRLHSHIPFLALEGIAMEWVRGYMKQGVGLMVNSWPMFKALKPLCGDSLTYLPNIYGLEIKPHVSFDPMGILRIGCLGAVRPLKNHLIQALAAIKFAQEKGMTLHFHINFSRLETGGEPVLKNIRALFDNLPRTKLIENKWLEHEDFVTQLQFLDLGMQVSLTETFSIVSADYVCASLPMVVSKEIAWAADACKAQDDDIDDMVRVMHKVYKNSWLVWLNQFLLKRNIKKATKMWFKFCRSC